MLCLLLLAVAMDMQASPAAGSSPTEAKEWFHRAQTGDIDRKQLDAAMNAALTDDLVKQTVTRLAALGPPSSFKYVRTFVGDDGGSTAIYRVALSSGTLLWTFSLDKDGLIGGFYVRPDSTLSLRLCGAGAGGRTRVSVGDRSQAFPRAD